MQSLLYNRQNLIIIMCITAVMYWDYLIDIEAMERPDSKRFYYNTTVGNRRQEAIEIWKTDYG